MAEKRFDITTSVSGAQDVDRLRESFEDLEDTVRDISGERVELEGADELADSFDDVRARAEDAGKAVLDVAETTRSEMVQAKAAADALGQALGPELAAKADLDAVVADFTKMGLSLDEIRQEADTLATALRQVDDVRLTGLSEGVDITNRGIDDMGTKGTQARSVLANLTGNAAQDLGELSGVVGSLGVGIGQLAEYAVDGNIKLKDLATLAGPIAALSGFLFAVQSANSAMAEFNESQQAVRDEQASFADSLLSSGEQIEVVNELLRQNAELTTPPELPEWADLINDLPLIGRLVADTEEQTAGLVETMAAAGITQEEWNAALNSGLEPWGNFIRQLESMHDAGQITDEQFALLTEQFHNYSNAALNASVTTSAMEEVFRSSMSGINQALADFDDQAGLTQELWNVVMADIRDNGQIDTQQAADAWNRLKVVLGNVSDQELTELANDRLPTLEESLKSGGSATDLLTDAWVRYQEALADTGQELADVASNLDIATLRAGAIATAFDELNARSQLDATQETVEFNDGLRTLHETLHDLSDALSDADFANIDLVPDTWDEVRNMPDELVPVLDALSAFRTSVQSEFSQAFEAGGSVSAREWAENTRAAVVEELALAGIESEEQVNTILSALGLLPEQVDMLIRVSTEEQALQVLRDLDSVLAGLPPEVQLRVTTLMQTDPVAALRLAVDEFAKAGIAVPVELVALLESFETEVGNATKSRTLPVEAELDTDAAETTAQGFVNTRRVATVDTAADTKTAGLDLDSFTGRPRTAGVGVSILQLLGAEVLLTILTRDRDANVTADALTADAEAELNHLARDRTSIIHTYAVGHGSGGGGGSGFSMGDEGNGPGPLGGATAAAPRGAPVPLGAEPAAQLATVTTTPTVFVEPATEVHVNVQAGVIGNGFDVERAVYNAVQDAVRFRGQRQVLTIAGRNA